MDLVIEKEPHSTYARELFSVAREKSLVMNVCAISYNNIFYMVRKRYGREKAKEAIELMSNIAKCLLVDHAVINLAKVSQFRDFEDAIQYYSAYQIQKCEAIITRNVKDFKLSNIPVMCPYEFLSDEV